jgi:hypothetical protein
MRHLTEDELVLHHYGESRDASAAEHLSVCGVCSGKLERIAADLALLDRLPVPERSDAYGAEVWRRLRPSLPEPDAPRARFIAWRPWALGASLAALLAVAFVAGRFWPERAETEPALASATRERILLYAVADHLDRSQVALLEFLHGDPSKPEDADRERRLAEELVSANRLYRQTASNAGERGVAGTLEELERVLLEIAHSSSPEAREALKRRSASEGILFKVRIVRSELGRREKAAVPPAAARS